MGKGKDINKATGLVLCISLVDLTREEMNEYDKGFWDSIPGEEFIIISTKDD